MYANPIGPKNLAASVATALPPSFLAITGAILSIFKNLISFSGIYFLAFSRIAAILPPSPAIPPMVDAIDVPPFLASSKTDFPAVAMAPPALPINEPAPLAAPLAAATVVSMIDDNAPLPKNTPSKPVSPLPSIPVIPLNIPPSLPRTLSLRAANLALILSPPNKSNKVPNIPPLSSETVVAFRPAPNNPSFFRRAFWLSFPSLSLFLLENFFFI